MLGVIVLSTIFICINLLQDGKSHLASCVKIRMTLSYHTKLKLDICKTETVLSIYCGGHIIGLSPKVNYLYLQSINILSTKSK